MSEFGFQTASPPNGGAIVPGVTPIIGGAVGQILFQGAGNVIQESPNLFWDNTNSRLGIGTSTPTNILTLNRNVNATDGIFVSNTNTGSLARTMLRFTNDASEIGQLSLFGSGTGVYANKTFFEATKDFVIGVDAGVASGGTSKFQVYVNGYNFATSPQFTIASTGNVLIGTTTDAGFRLDVNGTARVQGNTTIGINSNTALITSVRNSNSGSSSSTEIGIGNDSSAFIGSLATFSSTFSTPFVRNSICLVSYAYDVLIGTNLNVASGGANVIKFATGGSNAAQERMRIFSTGNVAINTTTDAGFRLDVNGTARVQGALTLSAASPSITLGGDLTITSTLYPSRVASFDILNSNLNLVAGGFGEGMFIGNRLTGSRTSTTFVSPDGLNAVGSAYISPYLSANGNVIIRASNNGNRSIQMTGLGASGSVLIGNITTGNGTQYSSILTIESTTQGFLLPRMTTTQKNAIVSPAGGLMVYDTTLNVISYYNGTMWI